MASGKADPLVVVVGCGRAKRTTPAPAEHLYRSTFVRSSVRWAHSVDARLLILSAKYGLVPASQVLEPYEATFATGGSYAVAPDGAHREPPVAPSVLAAQVASHAIPPGPVVVLAGAVYLAVLQRAAPSLAPYNPFYDAAIARYGDGRWGWQMHLMKRWHGVRPPFPPPPPTDPASVLARARAGR